MKKCDILILTCPVIFTNAPLQAPAILKAVLEKNGYKAHTYDLNHELQKLDDSDRETHDILKNYFTFGTLVDKQHILLVENYIKSIRDFIVNEYDTKHIALSVFTYQSQKFAELLASSIKEFNSDIGIVAGGQGIMSSGINGKLDWVHGLKESKIIDAYIVSEGERSLINYLEIKKAKGLNNDDWEQLTDLDSEPYPNYDDYNLDEYKSKKLLITGSRGCVRHCTFCDIHTHWKKFVWRSGKEIASEMVSQSKKYGINKFLFTDSLINGSMKAYRDFINTMSEHNETTDNKISWHGQFIVRGLKQMTEDDWVLTKKSGGDGLFLGVESGSEKIRDDMKKQFSDQDMDEFVEQAWKNKVSVSFGMIVGYPTETYDDFLETLKMFKRYQKYKEIFVEVALGTTLSILPGTPMAETFKNDMDLNNGENFWLYYKNPSLDFKERIKRRIILGEECIKMGYPVLNQTDDMKLLHFLYSVYKKNKKQIMFDLNTENVNNQKLS